MKKPFSLRDHLVNNLQFLKDNPDKITIFIENGRYRSTLATGYSMECIAPVKLLIQDYAGDPDLIAFLLFQWLRINQSELMANLETNKKALTFEVESLDNNKFDVLFELELTERVIVQKQSNGAFNFSYPEEPQYQAALPPTECFLLGENEEVLATWTSADPQDAVALAMPLSNHRRTF